MPSSLAQESGRAIHSILYLRRLSLPGFVDMVRVLIVALFLSSAVIEVSAALRGQQYIEGPLNSFETSCYHTKNPKGEEGGEKGKSYRGLVASTQSGRTCQKWTSDHPWKEAAAVNPTPDRESDEGMMTWGNGLGGKP